MLAPLTDIVGERGVTKSTKMKETKKKAFYWNESHQKAFDDIEATVARDLVLVYPDCNQIFEIFT